MTDLQRELAARLGGELPPEWREAYDATPRHLFLPDQGWRISDDGDISPRLDRTADPVAWMHAAYSEDAFVTQHERGRPTSSCSMPMMVFRMLRYLDVHEGHRVLEIGTGTGWNAALLAYRLGDANVVSVEIDPELAAPARRNLSACGRTPLVVAADGAHGYPPGAPYDRVEATCAVHTIPYPWVTQTRAGGLIVTPWGTAMSSLLARLHVVDGGRAEGRFVDTATFMSLRGQEWTVDDEPDDFEQSADTSSTALEALDVLSGDCRRALGLCLPDCKLTWDTSDETGYISMLWLLAPDAWASIEPYDGTVRQAGGRRLWDEVERAHRWWLDVGSPSPNRFGLTVTADRQQVWLDKPNNPVALGGGR